MRIKTLVGLALAAAPLVVLAQNANTPGGQASTGSPIDQTKTTSQKPAFDKSTSTKTSDGMAGTTGGTMSKSKPKTTSSAKSGTTPPAGDVPTYPAPAPDGTPTK